MRTQRGNQISFKIQHAFSPSQFLILEEKKRGYGETARRDGYFPRRFVGLTRIGV